MDETEVWSKTFFQEGIRKENIVVGAYSVLSPPFLSAHLLNQASLLNKVQLSVEEWNFNAFPSMSLLWFRLANSTIAKVRFGRTDLILGNHH